MIPNFKLYIFFLLKHEYLIVKYFIIEAYGYRTIVKVTNWRTKVWKELGKHASG
jgi:hypothetical protein